MTHTQTDAYLSSPQWKKSFWPHRDEKIFDEIRDAKHIKKIPNAFLYPNCIQSSLYLTECGMKEDSFVFCPGSHKFPESSEWRISGDAHRVIVPISEMKDKCVKVHTKPGDLILWYSKTIHCGGCPNMFPVRKRATDIKMPLWRCEKQKNDIQGIKECLEEYGACIVPLISGEEVSVILKQFVADLNEIFQPETPFTSWKDAPADASGKGGSAIPPITLAKWAWDCKLHPERVSLFQKLLGAEDICVGLDSVHWSPMNGRVSVMASFCPKSQRSEEAYKRKCIMAAWGKWRTSHWAQFSIPSIFCYGDRFRRGKHFETVSSNWIPWAAHSNSTSVLSELYHCTVHKAIQTIEFTTNKLSVKQAEELVKEDIRKFL